MSEVVIEETVAVDRTYSRLWGIVQVRHVMIEQYFKTWYTKMDGKGPYKHKVTVLIFGSEFFEFEIKCIEMPEVHINGNQVVGDSVIIKQKLR